MKRSLVCFTICFSLLGVALTSAQTQNQQPTSSGQPSSGGMNGMDMSQPAASSQTSAPGKPMDMGSGKSMNMGNCMAMMHGDMGHNAAPIPPGTLRVTFGDKSTDWTTAQLTTMPQTTVTVHNEHSKSDETYSGVPLMDLLAQLGVPATPHGKDMRLYLVAAGTDRYEAVYAVAEVNPSLHDAAVIVADTENGKPLLSDGPLKLIDSREKRPARWVRNLASVRVLAAE